MRVFVVDTGGDAAAVERGVEDILAALGIPADASAGYDILTDDGMSPEKAADLVAACVRGGRNAEDFARHMVKLRKAMA